VLTHLKVVTQVLLNHKSYTGSITHGPYFVGIITGSLIWVGFCWFTRLVWGASLLFTCDYGLMSSLSFRHPRLRFHTLNICTHVLIMLLQLLPRHHIRSWYMSKTHQ
jgi:hypothetical protein